MIQLCPRCSNPAVRIHRRRIDHIVNRLIPIRRYRCESMVCKWEGNVRFIEGPVSGPGPTPTQS